MKKFIALVLSLILSLSLVSCNEIFGDLKSGGVDGIPEPNENQMKLTAILIDYVDSFIEIADYERGLFRADDGEYFMGLISSLPEETDVRSDKIRGETYDIIIEKLEEKNKDALGFVFFLQENEEVDLKSETIATFKSFVEDPDIKKALFVDENNKEFIISFSVYTKMESELEAGKKYKLTYVDDDNGSVPPFYQYIFTIENAE